MEAFDSLVLLKLIQFLLYLSQYILSIFQILRIGFFEILKLNMPSYAVVDEVSLSFSPSITHSHSHISYVHIYDRNLVHFRM